MWRILCAKRDAAPCKAQMKISLNAATRSVYVLCKAPNTVIYNMHGHTPKKQSWRAVFSSICSIQRFSNAVIFSICKLKRLNAAVLSKSSR